MDEDGTGRITGVVYKWNTGEEEVVRFEESGEKLARFILQLSAVGAGFRQPHLGKAVVTPMKVTREDLLASAAGLEPVNSGESE